MTEITLKEIPVQILSLKPTDVIVLRGPADWTEEMYYTLGIFPMEKALKEVGRCNPVMWLPDNVALAVGTEE